MRTAVIGVGTMGGGMAHRLAVTGNDVAVYDLDPARFEPLVAAGARAASSPADAAAGAEFVITSLPRDEHVVDAISGAGGVIERLEPDAIVVETSTVSPHTCRSLEPAVRARSAAIVDAPVVTSQKKERREVPPEMAHEEMNIGRRSAVAGNLSFFVGGRPEDLSRLGDLLDILGLEHHHAGPLGAGAALKLINNAIVGTEVALLSELLVLSRLVEIEPARMVEILSQSSANSVILNTHIGGFSVRENFPPGLFPVDYMIKDLGLAQDLAESVGLQLDVVGSARRLFDQAAEAGLGHIYNPVVVKAIEARLATGGRR